MTASNYEKLLHRLAVQPADEDAFNALDATQPKHEKAGGPEKKIDQLMDRINTMIGDPSDEDVPAGPADATPAAQTESPMPIDDAFVPLEPSNFREAGLVESEVEALVLKFLLNVGQASGREMASHLKLPYTLLETLLQQMKDDRLIVYRSTGPMNDYVRQLTDVGRERARRHWDHCTYFGSAPVPMETYIASVHAQSIANQHPTANDLRRAFSDLLINQQMLARLGPAINSGRGLFLYGAPGNGKTSIAERVTAAFGETVWIPRAIGVDGEVIRLFDPNKHVEMPLPPTSSLLENRCIDHRWIRVRRPTIVVGGELTMEALEVTLNTSTGISEAPLQMKSNTGTLVIDDFGRQKMRVDELLNRWIVPLEKRFDFLQLANGKSVQVPFDQLIIFSTNLEPKDLVDDAFLRRIPYKIEVPDPSEEEFVELMKIMAKKLDIPYREDMVEYLIDTHFHGAGRTFRCCHPRDLLMQVRSACHFGEVEPEMSREAFDYAVDTYFAVMS